MEYEYDAAKSKINAAKHGVDFETAKMLWEDPDRLQVPARTQGEPRYMLIGRIEDKHWSAIFTMRGDTIRIVSVRRSRKGEVRAYED